MLKVQKFMILQHLQTLLIVILFLSQCCKVLGIYTTSLTFDHPITVINGANKIGKTSLLLIIECSHENFQNMIQQNPITTYVIYGGMCLFTSLESAISLYSYTLHWVGDNRQVQVEELQQVNHGQGLGKSSTDVKSYV
jgi:hypothetical protein